QNNTKVTASATIQPMALAPAFWAHPAVTVTTDVVRNSKNLEVSLVLDLTGSMSGSNVGDLKTAAQNLVDLVVKDPAQQTPYYSKAALVPWSSAVNVGALADQVRGPVVGTKSISGVSVWTTGSQLDVSGATKANPIVITTATNHNLTTGQMIMLTGVQGMTQINGVPYKVVNKTATTFSLQTAGGSNVNGSSYGTYSGSSGDKVTKCARTDCSVTVTATSHGYANGAYIYIDGVTPNSGLGSLINDKVYAISGVTTNTFNVFAGATTAAYSSGGNSYCTTYGCQYIRFLNNSSAVKVYKASNCVTERTAAQVTSDAAPSNTVMGFHYPATTPTYAGTSTPAYDNPCLTNTIIPLTATKATLTNAITLMAPGNVTQGTTGGQVGTAWGWYMLSPNFNYLWPSNAAAAYTAPDTLKVVVLMTDGALNTAYCNGVVSADSTPAYGFMAADHITCNATNGDTFTQAKALCDSMHAAKVVVYTVGFDLAGDTTAQDLMDHCATDAKHKYMPSSGTELKDAFKAIGADINNLRLAH
ncbi:ubiquitin-activating E1 FCCH domain-containing protein, partial [Phenylobacterium sp.]|uniref:ubiquitin-activating E1 FCCH domain-containing protein n=1 Tax=Phenylobacterium sp. TaxID=1871053 RepID=UPI002F3E81C3